MRVWQPAGPLVALAVACSPPPAERGPDPRTPEVPASAAATATTPPVERIAGTISNCGTPPRVVPGGRPFSDDLSGIALTTAKAEDSVRLLVHTDSRRDRSELYTLNFQSGEKAATHTFAGGSVDPEDLAVDRSSDPARVYLADVGDNQGGGRCLVYEKLGSWKDGTPRCRISGSVPGARSESACANAEHGLWLKKSVDSGRNEPYRIRRFLEPHAPGSVSTSVDLTWARYPHDAKGRCADSPCRVFPNDTSGGPASLGRFNAEALFVRRETVDRDTSLSAYIVTKAPLPLETELERQRDQHCRFEEDGRAIVFRIPGVDSLPAGDIGPRIEAVATLSLRAGDLNPRADSRLALRITAAAFEGRDLVLSTRSAAYRWFVPRGVRQLDQAFFDTHTPCIVGLPALERAPKLEGVALGQLLPDGERTYYVVSEGGDRYQRGDESLHRLTQVWSYDSTEARPGDEHGAGANGRRP